MQKSIDFFDQDVYTTDITIKQPFNRSERDMPDCYSRSLLRKERL